MNRDKEEELRAKAEGIPYFLVGPRSLTSSSRLQQVNDHILRLPYTFVSSDLCSEN